MAASALLVDYVLTVAVSVVAGVANIVSAFPSLAPHAVALVLGFVVLLAVMNLRGVKSPAPCSPSRPTPSCVGVPHADRGRVRACYGQPAGRGVGRLPITRRTTSRGLLLRRAGAARLRVRVHRADRRRGGQQRGAVLPAAQGAERRRHPGDHGRPRGDDVRRYHRAGAGRAGACRARDPRPLRATGRLRAAHRDRPDRPRRSSARSSGFYLSRRSLRRFSSSPRTRRSTASPSWPRSWRSDGYLPRQLHRRGDRLVFSNGVVVLAGLAGVLISGSTPTPPG